MTSRSSGKGWNRTSSIRPTFAANTSRTTMLNRYYSSAKIVLNDHWPDMRAHGFLSNRLYDALACGAFVISDAARASPRSSTARSRPTRTGTTCGARSSVPGRSGRAQDRADRGRPIVLDRTRSRTEPTPSSTSSDDGRRAAARPRVVAARSTGGSGAGAGCRTNPPEASAESQRDAPAGTDSRGRSLPRATPDTRQPRRAILRRRPAAFGTPPKHQRAPCAAAAAAYMNKDPYP